MVKGFHQLIHHALQKLKWVQMDQHDKNRKVYLKEAKIFLYNAYHLVHG